MRITDVLWKLFRGTKKEKEQRRKQRKAKPKAKPLEAQISAPKKKITVRLSEDLLKAYKHEAVNRNIPLQTLIEIAMRRYLEDEFAE